MAARKTRTRKRTEVISEAPVISTPDEMSSAGSMATPESAPEQKHFEPDFATRPREMGGMTEGSLKKELMRFISSQALMKKFFITEEQALELQTAVYDGACGFRWETLAGRPALRVLPRSVLETAYAIAKVLHGEQADEVKDYLLIRSRSYRR